MDTKDWRVSKKGAFSALTCACKAAKGAAKLAAAAKDAQASSKDFNKKEGFMIGAASLEKMKLKIPRPGEQPTGYLPCATGSTSGASGTRMCAF
jgi:hypothetical protein